LDAVRQSGPSVARDFKFEKRFVGLAFDEIHLQGLAAKVKQLGDELGASCFSISVNSGDDVEHLVIEDPEALGEQELPEKIGRVHIRFGSVTGDARCSIFLFPDSAALTVEGKNQIELRGLFSQLERELEL
jgi:hypothetical protein